MNRLSQRLIQKAANELILNLKAPTHTGIAKKLGVSPQAVSQFIKRQRNEFGLVTGYCAWYGKHN